MGCIQEIRGAGRLGILIDFTGRANSNGGTLLGPYLYFLTLSTRNEEAVSAAFRQGDYRDRIRHIVASAIATPGVEPN